MIEPVPQDVPPSASARGYLRSGLPAIYREPAVPGTGPPFAMRWMGGLEEVLDPTVTLLDNLAWHLDPRLAPEPIVRLLLGWLGLHAAARLPIEGARRVLVEAELVARRRGTLAGLRHVLGLAFPELDFDVRQSASFTEGSDPHERRMAPAPFLAIHCTRSPDPDDLTPLEPARERALRDLIVARLPVAVPYLLYLPGAS